MPQVYEQERKTAKMATTAAVVRGGEDLGDSDGGSSSGGGGSGALKTVINPETKQDVYVASVCAHCNKEVQLANGGKLDKERLRKYCSSANRTHSSSASSAEPDFVEEHIAQYSEIAVNWEHGWELAQFEDSKRMFPKAGGAHGKAGAQR
jgi:hypothetical protein